MRSQSPASLSFLLALALLAGSPAQADTLVLQDGLVFGKLKGIGSNSVTFAPACQAERVYAKAEIKRIERNVACTPRPITPYSAGGEICSGAPIELFEVVLKEPRQTIRASDVAVTGNRIHVRSADGLMLIHGPLSRLVSITRGLFCRSSDTNIPAVPGFCEEAVQHAVNFGLEPVFSNQILTRGLSFYFEEADGRPAPVSDPRGAVVREAFGTAITNWMGALQDLGPRLPQDLRAGLTGMISTSAHYTLLTPPQVVQVGCRDTAMFVVRWISGNAAPMTIGGNVKAARAQVEGRTIWLNGKTYPCWRSSLTGALKLDERSGGNECFNLVPVLIHEVGHALGLAGHADRHDHPSIMDSVISDAVTRPTGDDALDLAAVLAAHIQGAPAGRLDADGAGVEIRIRSRH